MVADYMACRTNNGNPSELLPWAFGRMAAAERSNVTREAALLATADLRRVQRNCRKPVAGAKSDHKMTLYDDDEGKKPIPQSTGLMRGTKQPFKHSDEWSPRQPLVTGFLFGSK